MTEDEQAPRRIHARHLVKHWAEALDLGPFVSRIVIDASVSDAVHVYVEKFGDNRLLHVDPPDPAKVDITFVE